MDMTRKPTKNKCKFLPKLDFPMHMDVHVSSLFTDSTLLPFTFFTFTYSYNLIVCRGAAGVECAALICRCGVCGVNMPVWGVRR